MKESIQPPTVVQTDVSTRRRAAIWLFFVTLIWGGTFVWMKKALDSAATHLEVWDLACVVGFMVLIRFLVAAITLPIFSTRARIALADKGAWKGGTILGLLMFGGFLTQMLALNEITPAVSAFLTSLYVVFTALIGLKMKSHPLTTVLVSGVILATFGAGFIDGPPHLTWGWAEILTVFSALLFALHIIFTDSVTKQFEPLAVTQTSFLVVVIASTLTLIFALIFTTVEIKIPNVLLVLAGREDAEYRKKLDNYIKKNKLEKNVLFVGFQNRGDLADLYKSSDIGLSNFRKTSLSIKNSILKL